ncbi:MAG TPA: MarC family protein [Burkholderiales bacterium]|jgi:small neutral amino acid transporter SnatA (MarC family)|nr:MarC family protein [Burkholderiales bacterium]
MLFEPHVSSFLLLFALLNPFLMSVYLMDLITDLPRPMFVRVLARGALISAAVFALFAWSGDALFSDVLHVRFASFQVFGGLIFLLIGARFVFTGADAMRAMRGQPEHLAGSIAMPFMIGPGTVSASVVVGARLPVLDAIGVIAITLTATVALVAAIKLTHDFLKERNARLIDRYVEIVGRISALLIGTFAVEMIFEGVGTWLQDTAPQWRVSIAG